jgi:hypothetical protein
MKTKTYSSQEIILFLEKFATPSHDNDNVELMMDDHFHIEFMNKGYYFPENNMLYKQQDEDLVEYIKDNFESK